MPIFNGRLIELIRKLCDMAASLELSITDLIALVTKLSGLFPLPDTSNETEFRAWCAKAAELGDEAADITETEVDDQVFQFLGRVVDNDSAWGLFYQLWSKYVLDGDIVLSVDDPQLHALSEKVGFNPAILISLIPVILKIIEFFRDRNEDSE